MKVFVICDANGECKGVVTDPELANRMGRYFGAYTSEHEVDALDLAVAEREAWHAAPLSPPDTDLDVDALVGGLYATRDTDPAPSLAGITDVVVPADRPTATS